MTEWEDAAERRDDAMERVEAAADAQWKLDSFVFLVKYLLANPEMFVDDLWDSGLPHTREDRALGPLFTKAVNRQLMVKSGRYRKSVRSNLTEKPVWRSLIYQGG